MWKSADYDHQLIQVSVCELDWDNEEREKKEGLIAYGTSFVFENYKRPGEEAIFMCELFSREEQPGFKIVRKMIVTRSGSDGEILWSQSHEFFVTPDFESTMPGVVVDELVRRTVNEYGRRIYAHENGLDNKSCP